MFRHLMQMMLASWVAAVLTVSPLVAALECQQCCGALSVARPSCSSEAEESVPACCQGKSTAPEQAPGRCDHCPKCELKRPLTAMVSGSFDWKLPTDFVTAILPPPADATALVEQALGSAREEAIDLGTPPPRVLFCCWRE